MTASRSPHLRPFDVPSTAGGGPDTRRLLVGEPDPRIGPVRCAWSNVPAEVRPRERAMVPAIGCGTMLGAVGLLAGFGLVGALSPRFLAPLYDLLRSADAVGYGLVGLVGAGFAFVGWRLGGRIGTGPDAPLTWFIGADGVQRNTLARGEVRREVTLFGERWAAYERVRKSVNGRFVGVFSSLRFVAREGYQPNVRVLPAVIGAVREAAVAARLAEIERSSGAALFPIFRDPGAEHADLRTQAGYIRVGQDSVELSDGHQGRTVPLDRVEVTLDQGDVVLTWPADQARVRLGWIGDGVTLLAVLAARGVMPPVEV